MDQLLTERFFTAISEMRRYLMQSKPSHGTTHSEIMVLHMIDNCDRRGARASTTWLSSRLGLTKSTVSQTLNSMEEKGWIRRGIDPDNRRQTTIDLTEAGRRKMEEIFQESKLRIAKVLETMGREDSERFIEMVEKFLDSVKVEFQRKE
jgi:DNA-binding MarR family transcriptional regulator